MAIPMSKGRGNEYPISNTHPTNGREAFATKNKIARAM